MQNRLSVIRYRDNPRPAERRDAVNSPIKSFEGLDCWKAGREVRVFVARQVAPLLPPEEKFLLRAQLLDAARSITANIAEGYGRYHYLDNSKFCSNARGSACEVLDHLIAAHDESLISAELLEMGRAKVDRALQLINGYMGYLRRQASIARRSPEDGATTAGSRITDNEPRT